MSKLRIVKHENMTYFTFLCPGCKRAHSLDSSWSWNQSVESPTFSPSILTANDLEYQVKRCHSFVENGKIRFLDDCFHELKGKIVDLPDLTDSTEDDARLAGVDND